ncbi:dynamin family protein [Leptotrichia massiliensis]
MNEIQKQKNWRKIDKLRNMDNYTILQKYAKKEIYIKNKIKEILYNAEELIEKVHLETNNQSQTQINMLRKIYFEKNKELKDFKEKTKNNLLKEIVLTVNKCNDDYLPFQTDNSKKYTKKLENEEDFSEIIPFLEDFNKKFKIFRYSEKKTETFEKIKQLAIEIEIELNYFLITVKKLCLNEINRNYILKKYDSVELKNDFGYRETSKNIEVFVMATMSSGKSTLINALLSKKLLPSSNEACTATITKVINKNQKNYSAKAFSVKKELLYEEYDISYEKMREWNNDENISEIEIYGMIPFANTLNLTLIDTPGPNNSRNIEHRKMLVKNLENVNKNTIILYVLNATQLGITDDSNLLDYLIKNAGNNTKNIIFALNKLDCFRNDDDISETLIKVCKYLEQKGVKKPNIFPLAALPALEIRSEPQSKEQKMERNYYVNRLNIDENLHLEKYSVIELENHKLKSIKDEERALLHTGIYTLENKIIERGREDERNFYKI